MQNRANDGKTEDGAGIDLPPKSFLVPECLRAALFSSGTCFLEGPIPIRGHPGSAGRRGSRGGRWGRRAGRREREGDGRDDEPVAGEREPDSRVRKEFREAYG